MKKIALFAITFGIATMSYSQVYVLGGVNFSNITQTSNGQTEKNNILTTFNGGMMGRFDLSKTVDLESGLVVMGEGSKAETYFGSGTSDNYVKSRFNPIYLQVPLNLVIKVPLDKHSNIFFHAGPYAAIGIAGRSTVQSNALGLNSSSQSDIKFSNDNPFTSKQDDAAYDKLKRFDFGLNFGAGFDFKKLMLKANYGLGLAKINSTQSDNNANDKNKYRTVSISLGIPLGR